MRRVFKTAPVDGNTWEAQMGLAVCMYVWYEPGHQVFLPITCGHITYNVKFINEI